jgi:diaminopimelate decarboxylase
VSKHNILNGISKPGSYFVYDLDGLYQHASIMSKGSSRLFFACKANPLTAVISTLNNADLSFDIASEGELRQVLSVGVPGEKIIMTGPAKPESLMRLGLENKISTFVIESASQINLLQSIVKDYGYTPSILLRLQLQWEHKGESVLGGDQITPFGLDLETAGNVLRKLKLPFLGFHVFQWGNVLSLETLKNIWNDTITACKKLTSDFQVLDVGGGLGIPYKQGDIHLKWSEVNDVLSELKATYNIPEIWLEMGRYLTGPYGEYITSVVDVKRTYGQDILVLEGGINHFARPALVNEYFPAELLRESTSSLKSFSLHGPLCTALDFLGKHDLPADIAIGDVIVFKQIGAYGFTESMPFFLCHNLPGEAVIDQGKLRIIREPQSAKTWLK